MPQRTLGSFFTPLVPSKRSIQPENVRSASILSSVSPPSPPRPRGKRKTAKVQGGGGRRKGNETSSSQTIKPDAVKRSTCQASLKSIWSSASADNGSENLVAEAGTDHQEHEHEQSMIVERKTKVEEPRVGGTVTPTPHKAVQVQGEASISPAAEIESSPSTVQ